MSRAGSAPRQPSDLFEEALTHLRAYLRLDTSNPPGRETPAALYVLDLLRREGIEGSLVEPRPGRGSLVARLPGERRDAGPLVLLHHADVVPADSREWSEDPFGARVRDGYLYGRGAIDMKGVGILHLMALLWLHRNRVPLRRDLVLLLVADEETGGALGARHLLETLPWLETAALVLDEGGFITPRAEAQGGDLYCVSVAEKVPVQFMLRAEGSGGHGSVPRPHAATARIVAGVNRILALGAAPRLHPVVRAYLEAAGTQDPGGAAAAPVAIEERLKDPRVREVLFADPLHRAMLHDTVACTLLRAGEKINVVPSAAEAGMDCRLLPDRCPDAFLEEVREVLSGLDLRVEPVLQETESGVSPLRGGFMEVLADCVRETPGGGTVAPFLMTGAADGRHFRRRGVPTYGFAPFRLSRGEHARMHGADERLALENLEFGLGFFCRLLQRLMTRESLREE